MLNQLYIKQAAALLFMAMVACFFACKKDEPLPDVVSFSNHIQPLFNAHCNSSSCHSGGSPAGNLNLTAAVAYSQLFAKNEVDTINVNASVLYIEVNSGTMPKNAGKLSNYNIGLIQKWIQQGAKNN